MSSQTKIIVLRMKSIIYTAVFTALAIVFLVIVVLMFSRSDGGDTAVNTDPASYTPGRYCASLVVNSNPTEVTVTVDKAGIKSIRFSHLDDTVSASYPLMEPALEDLADQIVKNQSLENIDCKDDMKYTQTALLDTIRTALSKAASGS